MKIKGGHIFKKRLEINMKDLSDIVDQILQGKNVKLLCGTVEKGMDVLFVCYEGNGEEYEKEVEEET